MITVNVPVANPYDVMIGTGILSQIGKKIQQLLPKAKKVAIITDDHVKALYLTDVKRNVSEIGLEVFDYCINPGEASKNGANYLTIQSWLAEVGITGTDVIIALGGGVVGDLAGFVAATYLRGIAYIQMPSTLLAMVDSSVGGKTAIDLPEGKNLVGAFYQPAFVLCDIDLLDTLADDILHDGYSEVIKYGMLGDRQLLADLAKEQVDINEVVATCVRMKRDIVCTDEFDKGVRKLLNFGHTVGHAIEQVSGYQISHGKAVAMGMAIDTRAAVKTGLCDASVLTTLLNLLEKYHLPSVTMYGAQELFDGATRDKKRSGDMITNVIPTALGKCELQDILMDELYEWIEKGGL